MVQINMNRTYNDDSELYECIKKIAQQDRRAFEQFYFQFAPRLGRFLTKFLKQDDLLEEAVSDVMIVVWKNAERYKPSAKVSTWVFGIAYNKALKILERDRRYQHRNVSMEEEAMDIEIEDHERPDFLLLNSDLRNSISQALDTLSSDHRAVIELTFFEGLSYPEIAEIMDCPTNTVKTRAYHAKKQLMKYFAEYDLGMDA